MCRRYLPMNALRALEVAARHRSLTRAADELSVTPAAVHHQIKSLEALLSVSLLVRSGNGMALTPAAAAALPTLEAAFDMLSLATEKIRQHASGGVLSISCCPSFAQKWLLPRLARFRADFEGIELRIATASHLPDLSRTEIDVAIAYGTTDRFQSAAVCAEALMNEQVVPVCSPAFRAANGLLTVGELLGCVLLHDDAALTEQGADWDTWLAANGAGASSLTDNVRFDSAAMAIDAAVAGQGVALGRASLVTGDLLAGRLVEPFPTPLPVTGGYVLACLHAMDDHPRVSAFREWLFAEASRDRAGGSRVRNPSSIKDIDFRGSNRATTP